MIREMLNDFTSEDLPQSVAETVDEYVDIHVHRCRVTAYHWRLQRGLGWTPPAASKSITMFVCKDLQKALCKWLLVTSFKLHIYQIALHH